MISGHGVRVLAIIFSGVVANEEQGRNLAVVSGESSNGVGTRASGSQAFLNSEVS